MALTVTAVAGAAIRGALTALDAHIRDPAWFCGTSADLAIPPAEALEHRAAAGEKVLVVRDGGTRVGLAVVRPSDGRLRWVLCRPAYYADVLTALGEHIAAAWGVNGWAWNEGDNERTRALRAHPRLKITDEKSTEDGTLLIRAEWAG